MDIISKLLAMGGGVLCILASIYDWDWFFDNFRARPFVRLLGREGARWFYAILGLFLMVMSFRFMPSSLF